MGKGVLSGFAQDILETFEVFRGQTSKVSSAKPPVENFPRLSGPVWREQMGTLFNARSLGMSIK
jgi:hypothetical protein